MLKFCAWLGVNMLWIAPKSQTWSTRTRCKIRICADSWKRPDVTHYSNHLCRDCSSHHHKWMDGHTNVYGLITWHTKTITCLCPLVPVNLKVVNFKIQIFCGKKSCIFNRACLRAERLVSSLHIVSVFCLFVCLVAYGQLQNLLWFQIFTLSIAWCKLVSLSITTFIVCGIT